MGQRHDGTTLKAFRGAPCPVALDDLLGDPSDPVGPVARLAETISAWMRDPAFDVGGQVTFQAAVSLFVSWPLLI